MRKAYKKGEIIEKSPYLEIIENYKQIYKEILAKGWKEQAKIYSKQIKIYQEKLKKLEKLVEVEAEKVQRQKDIENFHKIKKELKSEEVTEIEPANKEQNILLDKAMNLIDEAEKTVKNYELRSNKDVLKYDSPYEFAINNYEKAQDIFQKIDWKDGVNNLINTIKFYKDKKDRDDRLRDQEQKKLEEPKIEKKVSKIESDKVILEGKKKISEFEQKEKEVDDPASEIFNIIENAEQMAQEYELKIKSGIFDFEAPYEKIINIYREARKLFEEINWKDESTKLLDTIKFYKEKLENDKKIRSLEAEKVKQRGEELLYQQDLLKKARLEQEKLLKERKEALLLRKERVIQFETEKEKAFRLMDRAKLELNQNSFEKAIE